MLFSGTSTATDQSIFDILHISAADPAQAVLGGCIPVIFDYECSAMSNSGVDFSNMEVSAMRYNVRVRPGYRCTRVW